MSWFTKPAPVTASNPKGQRVAKTRLTGTLAAAAIALVGSYEGLRLNAYRDVVGIPTICFGETRGVKMGDKATRSECDAMLGAALVEFEAGMRKCLVAPDAIPEKPYMVFLSTTYNIGPAAFCGSSMARKINAGDIRGACDSILAWNKGGKPLRPIAGLTRRRKEERALCIEGL